MRLIISERDYIRNRKSVSKQANSADQLKISFVFTASKKGAAIAYNRIYLFVYM